MSCCQAVALLQSLASRLHRTVLVAGPKRRVLGIVAVPHTRTSVTSISLHVGQLFTTESLSEVQVKVSVIEGTGGEV